MNSFYQDKVAEWKSQKHPWFIQTDLLVLIVLLFHLKSSRLERPKNNILILISLNYNLN